MKQLIRGIDRLNTAIKFVLGVFLMIMSVTIIVQVFFRFVIRTALPWSEELTRYLMVYIVFVGAGYAVRYNQLMRVEMVEMLLPKRVRKWYILVVNVAMIWAFSIITNAGVNFMIITLNQRSPALQIPMPVVYLAIPLGGVLMIVNAITLVVENFVNDRQAGEDEKERTVL